MFTENILTILERVLDESGYTKALVEAHNPEADNRLENLQELRSSAKAFLEKSEDPSLANYLATVSLTADIDGLDTEKNHVSMMTIHAAKGLEFPVVFVTGLEQGLFPHERSLNDPSALEEERRLCYVAFTRAESRLYLTYADARLLWGERKDAVPSQFLKELPLEYMDYGKEQQLTKPPAAKNKLVRVQAHELKVGDRVLHSSYGQGKVTHLLSSPTQLAVAVQFPGLGKKIINPQQTALFRL
jgi:DNA helicase-2/ATP-dependent DNA helicase PcrA